MPAKTHKHKLKRVNIGVKKEYIVYKCALSDCSYYVARKLAVGKETICWKCSTVFTMKPRDLDYARPLCINCKGTLRPDIAAHNRRVHNKELFEQVTETPDELLQLLSGLPGLE